MRTLICGSTALVGCIVEMTAFATLCLGVCMGQGEQSGAYSIKVDRPVRAGTRYSEKREIVMRTHSLAKHTGRVANEEREELTIDFEGVESILEASSAGEPIKSSVRLVHCRVAKDGIISNLQCENPIIVTYFENKLPEFSIEGSSVEPELREAMFWLFPDRADGRTDDDLYGTQKSVRVGEQWQINSEQVTRAMKEADNVPIKNVRGHAELIRLVTVGAKQCYQVDATWRYDRVVPPILPEYKVLKAETVISISEICPMETNAPIKEVRAKKVNTTHYRTVEPYKGAFLDLEFIVDLQVNREQETVPVADRDFRQDDSSQEEGNN